MTSFPDSLFKVHMRTGAYGAYEKDCVLKYFSDRHEVSFAA